MYYIEMHKYIILMWHRGCKCSHVKNQHRQREGDTPPKTIGEGKNEEAHEKNNIMQSCRECLQTLGGALFCQVENHVRTKKNLLFLSCITKMGQTFIKKNSWVDIHGIYYIVETDNQIWWSFFLENIPFLTRMTHN